MSTHADPQNPTAPPRHRRWPRRLALGTAITLAILFAGHLTWYLLASAELDRARAAASAAGLSQDAATVIPPPCADADNAALRYQHAIGLLTLGGEPYFPGRSAGRLDPRLQALLQQDQRHPPDRKEQAEPLVAQAAATLQVLDHEDFSRAWRLVAEGARLPRCRFDLEYGRGGAMPLPHLGLLRQLGYLGSLRARLLAASGRSQEAADQFADLLWMLRQHRQEAPLQADMLLSLHVEDRVLAHLRLALQAGQLAGADTGRCRLALADQQRAQLWPRILAGEVALIGTWAFRHVTDGFKPYYFAGMDSGLVADLTWSLYDSWCGAPARAADEADYLRLCTGLVTGGLQPGTIATTDRWPLTRMLTGMSGVVHRRLLVADRRAAAAALALLAQAALEPKARTGVAVEHCADGSWLITPSVGDDPRFPREALAPWRVPLLR